MPSELIFRAQLVFFEQKHIYDYWCRQAGQKAMPALDDFNVEQIAEVAQSVSLIETDTTLSQGIFKSVGMHTKDIYGFDLTFKRIWEINWGIYNNYWKEVYKLLAIDHLPRCGVTKGAVKGQDNFAMFWLRLPLSNDGKNVTHIVCHDIPQPLTEFKSSSYSKLDFDKQKENRVNFA